MKDGNHASKLIHDLLQPVSENNGNRGTFPNLFSSCPPLQIDANFGGSLGIAEMLVQSQEGYIELLPTLPDAWKTGHFEGLKVRGGGEVSAKWQQGVLKTLKLKASVSNTFRLKIPENWDINKLKQKKFSNFELENKLLIISLKTNQEVLINFP